LNKKKINFRSATTIRNNDPIIGKDVEKKIDDWISGGQETSNNNAQALQAEEKPPEPVMSRFTIVIPEYMHRRIKKYCAAHGISMKERLLTLLEKEFPEI